MSRFISITLAGIILLLSVPMLAGCNTVQADPDAPFYQDRIAAVRLSMSPEAWDQCRDYPYEESYVRADFCFDGMTVPDVAVRTKGNSTLSQAVEHGNIRFPFAVDFNFFNAARNFCGLKKVFLNNGWSDPTLVREVLTYSLFADFGLPTPRASLIDLWVNDTHLGVYTMVEMIDSTFVEDRFGHKAGNLYKPELVSARLDWTEKDAEKSMGMGMFAPPPGPEYPEEFYLNIGGAPLIDLLIALGQTDLIPGYDESAHQPATSLQTHFPKTLIEGMQLKTNTRDPDHSSLYALLEVINSPPGDDFEARIEQVLDVELSLKFIAASAVTLHLDNYIGIGHNNYWYDDKGKYVPIVWDTNMAFGTFNLGIRRQGLIDYYIDEPTAGLMNRYPFVNALLSHPAYLEQYRNYVRDFIEGPFAPESVLPRIEALREMVRPYAAADETMFYSYEDWERCFIEDLRPPDVFEGWQAGGPSPALPWRLDARETEALWKEFKVRSLWELLMRPLSPEEIDKLGECLERENFELFLQNRFGPMMSPQTARRAGFGPNSLGLITMYQERYDSVLAQLNGEQPSGSGSGKGNGGSMWMADMFRR